MASYNCKNPPTCLCSGDKVRLFGMTYSVQNAYLRNDDDPQTPSLSSNPNLLLKA